MSLKIDRNFNTTFWVSDKSLNTVFKKEILNEFNIRAEVIQILKSQSFTKTFEHLNKVENKFLSLIYSKTKNYFNSIFDIKMDSIAK